MLAHWRSPRTLIWAGILLVTAVVLSLLPLVSRLGFEFSFTLALLSSLASVDLAAAFVRRLRASPRPPLERADQPGRVLTGMWARAALIDLSLLVLPLLVITANGLRVRNCDWGFGFLSYLLLPVVSTLGATAVGVATAVIAGNHRKLSNALPYLVYVASLLGAVWRFYDNPPIFVYNLFAGYFPGNLYDENVGFHLPMLWSRLCQAATLLAILAAAAWWLDVPSLTLKRRRARRPDGWRIRAALLFAAGAGLALLLWCRSASLGFAIDADYIARTLGGRYETTHFVIYYPRGGEIERDIAAIAADHEFRYAQLVKTFQVEPAGKITSFYFESAAQKFALMGASQVYMAKPWRNEIYVQHARFPHPVLRHEIAHVIAGQFGDPIFHMSVGTRFGLPVAFNVGLIEGLAVAGDWPDHRSQLTPHQSVKAMIELGVAPPIDQILSTSFLTFSPSRSYTVAGSFVRYLLDSYGPARLRVLYRTGGDFMAAYGRPQAQFVADWRRMIDQVKLPPHAAELVRERFRRPSILHRPCPHAIARRMHEVQGLIGDGRLARALDVMRQICSDAPDEPRYQLALARLLLRSGASSAAKPVLDRLADAPEVSSTLRAEALGDLAELAVHADDRTGAAALLDRATALPLDDDTRRSLMARRFALDHPGPAGDALREYFWANDRITGWDPVLLATRAALTMSAEPELGLGYYLLGFTSRGRGAPADTAHLLATALRLGLPDPLLTRECASQLAAAAFLAGDYDTVRTAAAVLTAADQPELVRLDGADWLERVTFAETGRLPESPSAGATEPAPPATSR